MSIDERIVKMQFDNNQFERNVQTSIKSLDDLKKGLNLEGAAKSLTELDKVGKRFSLAGISEGVEALNQKFSAFGIMGITVLQNLTNSALNFGKRLVSSLTIDPIKTGLGEYETKIGAIQTILTNTASKGTTLSEVNDVLADLNTYADKTIYNFAEMTRNIGTFTAAGVGLKESAVAIKGIANLAAGSGSTSQQASTAMYQLSQALAAGSVKLQDWNSVVNAGMGGELFQNALKTTAKEMGIVVNASVPFRESLKDGWVTSEVLTKTLAKFAEDESLVKAATQVKTFTQLFDTMKESVQSGWAVSWENIIGDKDTATTLLTGLSDAFNSVTGASADARNQMLSFWKDNGGRAAIIEAIANAFQGLGSVLEPIENAFREIFPALDGQKLVDFSKGLRDLTSNFKMSDETADKLKRTFKGMFALVDIGIELIKAIGKGLGSMINYLLPAGDGFLSITASIGDFLVGLDESIKTTNIFNKAIEKIGNFLAPIADGVKKSVSVIFDAVKSFGSIDTSGLDSFSERVKTRFEPFTKLGELIHSAFSKITDVLKKVAPVFYKLSELVGEAFGKLRDSIVGSLDNAEFNSIFDIINGGLFAAILVGIKKFISSLTEITDGAGGFFDGITGILDGVKGSLEAWQSSLKAGTLLKIATAIGILAGALVVLSLIDSAKLTSALAAMTGMFIDLFGSMAIFQKIMGSEGFKGIGKVTTAMIGLSAAVLILSVAMTNLATLDWNGIAKGLTAVAVLSGTLVASAKILSTGSRGLIKGSLGFILFAGAITILSEAVMKLSTVDTAGLTKGLLSIGALAAELSLFMNFTNLKGMGIGKGLGFLGLAASVLILAEAVKKLSSIDTASLLKGLAGLGLVLTELGIFINLTGDSKRVIATATGMTILGAAMLIIADALGKMGSMSLEQIGKGLLAMAGAIGVITVAVNAMPKNMISSGLGLLAISGALVVLSNALLNMGSMSWEGIAKGLVTLAGSLIIISGAMMLMQSALPGAAALLVVAGALAILAPVLQTLGGMSLSEIGKGLLALVGVFTVLGVAGLLLAPLTPIILGLSGAIALLGVGCLAVGAGLLAFSAGLAALAVSGTAGAAALTLVVTSIVGLIPFIAKTLAKGIIDFVKIIGDGMPVITKALKDMVVSIVTMLVEVTPVIVDGLFKLLMVILDTLVSYVPKITDAGMKIILGFLKGIANNIREVVKTGVDIVVNFIKGVASKLPDIIQAGIDLIISFINGLADGIRKNNRLIVDSVVNLIDAMVDAFTENVVRFTVVGKNLVTGLVNGIREGISSVVAGAKELATSAVDAAKSALGIHSPSRLFKAIGENLGNALGLGIDENKKEAVDASTEMGNDVAKAAGDAGVKATEESNKAAKAAFDKSVEWIDERKYYNKLSLDEELSKWKEIQSKYAKGTEERKKADREVYRVKKELRKKDYDDAIANINNLKYYDKLTLAEELAEWTKVQKKYKKNSPEYAEANKEIYRLNKELKSKMLELEEDFHAKSKEIIDKSIQDINDLNAAYEQAVDDRTKALYSAYSLFDKVDISEPVSGYELINNLQGQVTAFELWSKNISELAQKGIGDGLLKELEAMGPDALSEVQALNNLSKPELDKYVQLWATKYMSARTKATLELEGLKVETQTKIDEINRQTQTDLSAVNTTWQTKLAELTGTSKQQLGDLSFAFSSSVDEITETTKQKFTRMADAIVKDVDWSGVGVNIIDGIKSGVLSEAKSLAETAANVALQALKATKKALGIKSPSREFAEVGMYADKGFAVGLDKYSGEVTSSVENIGSVAVSAMRDAISNISKVIANDIDSAPSIRPVMDLSDVRNGINSINGMISKETGINLFGVTKKLPVIENQNEQTVTTKNSGSDKVSSPISFTQNNYSPKPLSRIEIYRQTRNQISTLKGLVEP